MKISEIHRTKAIYHRIGATADFRLRKKFLERKEWPEPTGALLTQEPICYVEGKGHEDEFLDLERELINSIISFLKNKLFILDYSGFRFSEKLQR